MAINAFAKAASAFWGRLRGVPAAGPPAGIGLALGGGFSRGIAHVGVLRVFEREGVPVQWIAGVSAGSIVAAGYAGGADSRHLEAVARSMKMKDVAGWRLSKLGVMATHKMEEFLRRALPVHTFERMKIPLTVVATDLSTGEPVLFQGNGEIFSPVRASCSYPGLFQPVQHNGRYLVDGAISMEIPAQALRHAGPMPTVSVALPPPLVSPDPSSVFSVVNRCFQIMQRRTEAYWRAHSDLVLTPDVHGVSWDDFGQVTRLIEAGIQAAEKALPNIWALLNGRQLRRAS
ncbi:MAG: patatin-like phospholipase family protein [Bryobacterales bacterium]|nr:patatin-like phospholipase family protein [Bryobacterales bacterium]